MTGYPISRTVAVLAAAGLIVTLTATALAAEVEPAGSRKPVVRCYGKPATIVGTNKGEVIRGTVRRDVIVASGGNDTIYGRGGHDIICAGPGNDRVLGGNGNDYVLGGIGADRLIGGPGRDTLHGQSGHDRLDGGPGPDRLFGWTGNDLIVGGAGDDHMLGNGGDDRLFGGDGRDSLGGGPGHDRCIPGARAGPHYRCELFPRVPPRDLAIAFSDLDGNGRYSAGDVLISRLFDTNGDGIPSAGDEILLGKYPTNFAATAFADWGVERHVVTGLADMLDFVPYSRRDIHVTSDQGQHLWIEIEGREQGDAYVEDVGPDCTCVTAIVDIGTGNRFEDKIGIAGGSPSEPSTPVALTTRTKRSDDRFIDVIVYP